jgi:hypothetical protein
MRVRIKKEVGQLYRWTLTNQGLGPINKKAGLQSCFSARNDSFFFRISLAILIKLKTSLRVAELDRLSPVETRLLFLLHLVIKITSLLVV